MRIIYIAYRKVNDAFMSRTVQQPRHLIGEGGSFTGVHRRSCWRLWHATLSLFQHVRSPAHLPLANTIHPPHLIRIIQLFYTGLTVSCFISLPSRSAPSFIGGYPEHVQFNQKSHSVCCLPWCVSCCLLLAWMAFGLGCQGH